jgi:predicted AAA+ superfamily ATPase
MVLMLLFKAIIQVKTVKKEGFMIKSTIYVISGPAGVGKSTTSKELVKTLERSAYISGDDISHIPVNGRGKPWLCQETLSLTWENVISSTFM